MYILGNGWSVFTPGDALASLDWLAKSGHRASYAAAHGTSVEAFHGWDFARMANVAGWAYVAYLIDRETAWTWMRRAAAGAKAAFGSFAELGQSVASLVGATGPVTRTAGAGVPLIAAGCVAVVSGTIAGALH